MMPLSQRITLQNLLPGINLGSAAPINISGVKLDSRAIEPGDVFIALVGAKIDGRQFIAKAIEQGAVGILVEADKQWQGTNWIGKVPVIAIDGLANQVSQIAGNFYAHPSLRCRLIGVTGTNGKTTCALLIAQLAALLATHKAETAGVVGTLGFGVLDANSLAPLDQQISAIQSTGLTTPDPVTLQKILADLVEQKAKTIAIEVSSHSLVLGRVAALQFDTAIFTNLTQDHLDFHGDLASYGKAKAQLLKHANLKYAIVNADDAWAKNLLEQMPENVSAVSFSINNNDADVYLSNLTLTASGASAQLHSPWGVAELIAPFIGKFNLSNLLAVIAAMCVGDADLKSVMNLIPQLQAAPGRMQSVVLDDSQQDIQVIVDYAHTPDALENTLQAIREHTQSRVWSVFGCGGDRDKTKRPLMGRVAEMHSDYVIITNDNPRNEEPSAIAADIIRGLHNPNGCLVIADRAQAIDFAIQQAKSGDLILIAGKGHEDYQIFAEQTIAFSDTKQARLALQRRIAKRDLENFNEQDQQGSL
ncbi:UDP-N-acetylmuramoyl-L-alanyl-D-glutamate--2,6-diaminopimelate ligase [Cellvibrio zantedeschiae]|uniref:UDP-N-acetylmuramoyl-L-alanyl-D-glutamate--2,6-diaminopimelate ligase n=1 Tax=Cellvibrio zantedeschiae TaxID=1237077 RepID=A0ABQ3AS09_9GAMM|nr:UDP-N-acetylmuramoyl-L-alanyl-D-glutamate--2,6-diaminopimelate ligase [Cellvibrio zantedeschiae]GGY62737.1 UDP-N-acetylmuramoyl-L-alanyl-D-glutamate--2,6-diaminopimelate ligase [Cellvibrio zantedeschiae]